MKGSLKKKSLGPDDFPVWFHQTFKEKNLPPVIHYLLEKEEEEIVPYSLYKASVILLLKPNKYSTKKRKKEKSDQMELILGYRTAEMQYGAVTLMKSVAVSLKSTNKKLSMRVPRHWGSVLQGVYPRETKTCSHRNVCMNAHRRFLCK